jgi:hypothetical protein
MVQDIGIQCSHLRRIGSLIGDQSPASSSQLTPGNLRWRAPWLRMRTLHGKPRSTAAAHRPGHVPGTAAPPTVPNGERERPQQVVDTVSFPALPRF